MYFARRFLGFKRFVSFLLVFSTLFSLCFLFGCGCSEKGEKSKSSGKPVVKISLFSHKFESKAAYDKIIKKYEELNPDVKISFEAAGGSADYVAELKSRMASNAVTMFNYSGLGEEKIWQDSLLDLSKFPEAAWVKEQCNPALMEGENDKNMQFFGVPEAVESIGLLANKRIFDDAGIDVATMNTFSGLKAGVEQLNQKIRSGELKDKYPNLETAFSFAGKERWIFGQHMLHSILPGDFKTSAEAWEAGELQFKKADVYKAWIDFQSTNALPAGKTDRSILNSVDYTAAFDNGLLMKKCAVTQQGSWTLPAIAKFDEDNKTHMMDDLVFLSYSIPDGSTDEKLIAYIGQNWGINSKVSEDQQKACLNFLKWLYTSEEGRKLVAEELKYLSPYAKDEELDAFASTNNINKKMVEAIKANKIITGQLGLVRSEAWSRDVCGANVQKYLANALTWDDFVKEAKTKWTEIFNKQNSKSKA